MLAYVLTNPQRSIARSSQLYEAILRLSTHCFGFIAANFLIRLNLSSVAFPVFQQYTTCPDAHNRQMK